MAGRSFAALHQASPQSATVMCARGVPQAWAASRARPVNTGCQDSLLGAASAAGACARGALPMGCEIMILAFPSRFLRYTSMRIGHWLSAHFGIVEHWYRWRMHHTMRPQTANCVATARFRRGPTLWV